MNAFLYSSPQFTWVMRAQKIRISNAVKNNTETEQTEIYSR
jgi:hypothetical protein